ncbi:uncharacterized protein [Rutidosis leptorrhynchoides]|uniref:uncharacterized protein n=1 Tax=Rutidosis leptorrhynchoides TaxID=125765 RepID=UPI003A9A507C
MGKIVIVMGIKVDIVNCKSVEIELCFGSWDWCRQPRGRAAGDLVELSRLISGLKFDSGRRDSWRWHPGSNGCFTTNKLTSMIDEKTLVTGSNNLETLRDYLTPKKVEIFVWRARKKRLPVLIELDKRGIDLYSVRCSLCDGDIESVDHSILSCKLASEVWSKVFDWWGLPFHSNLDIGEIFSEQPSLTSSAQRSKIWQAVTWICGYLIWGNRNQKVFKGKSWNAPMALCEIQVKTHEWIARSQYVGNEILLVTSCSELVVALNGLYSVISPVFV